MQIKITTKLFYGVIIFCLINLIKPEVTQSRTLNVISGITMGTFYKIKFVSEQNISQSLLKKKINICLQEINKKMSMYETDSEISRFNRHPAGKPFKLSPDIYRIMSTARQIYTLTNGAWDCTIKPLVDLWGFGVNPAIPYMPSSKIISKTMERVGFHYLTISRNETGHPVLTASIPALTLDMSSVAKGYGVDMLTKLLKKSGIANFLIDIGGELAASGKNHQRKPWNIGINRPSKNNAEQGLYLIVSIKDMSIATSGDYRNYFARNQKTYSHIINPKTGYPIDNNIVSATVIARECAFADGLATALMVMNIKESLDLVNSLKQVECLIIKEEKKKFISFESESFSNFVINSQ